MLYSSTFYTFPPPCWRSWWASPCCPHWWTCWGSPWRCRGRCSRPPPSLSSSGGRPVLWSPPPPPTAACWPGCSTWRCGGPRAGLAWWTGGSAPWSQTRNKTILLSSFICWYNYSLKVSHKNSDIGPGHPTLLQTLGNSRSNLQYLDTSHSFSSRYDDFTLHPTSITEFVSYRWCSPATSTVSSSAYTAWLMDRTPEEVLTVLASFLTSCVSVERWSNG